MLTNPNRKIFVLALVLGSRLGMLSAQTIVSTTPENKNAVLETYGGIYCVYCPQGNTIAEQIKAEHPDDVVLINIHAGSYAVPQNNDPDLRTDFGEALKDQTGLSGYPAGTVNRQVFPGLEQGNPGTTAMSRGNWNGAVGQVLLQPSPVNIAATAHIDVPSRVLSVYVEIFYTANSPSFTNYLNVALLQSRIDGPQAGHYDDGDYRHKDILRHMLTGQWGAAITPTTTGHFESRTFTYTLPEDYREVPVDPADLQIAIFIAEGHQKIITGITVTPDYTVTYPTDANALEVRMPEVVCGEIAAPVLTLRNDGNTNLTSAAIQYSVNGGPANVYNWQGNLSTFQSTEISLPPISFIPIGQDDPNTLLVSIYSPNGQGDGNVSNNFNTVDFNNPPTTADPTIILELKTDYYGYETYWEILDDSNVVLANGGNVVVGASGGGLNNAGANDPGAYSNNHFYYFPVDLPDNGCYRLRLLDAYGDGMCCSYGGGFYRLRNIQGSQMLYGGVFGAEKQESFRIGAVAVTALEDQEIVPVLEVFPNPSRTGHWDVKITLPHAAQVSARLVNASGQEAWQLPLQQVKTGTSFFQIDPLALPQGFYFLNWMIDDQIITQKLLVFP